MIGRFALGLVKGLVLGALVGATFHFALHVPLAEGILGTLLAMGTGSTAGILAGRPPWRQDLWLESVLRSAFGMMVGAGLFYAASRWARLPMPIAAFGLPRGTPIFAAPLLFLPLVGAFFGAIVELDHTRDASQPAR